ncbi:MAG: hypothetical protein C5B50_30000 [Verrucomicrobia bacterium]|nr:MAG: hypothetical protein C5B50_30000 [Verrucomicrobiota bacterium]
MIGVEEREAKYRSDPRSTKELLHLTLQSEADRDGDEYWHPLWTLQHRLPQVLGEVRNLLESSDAKSREVGSDILGQNGVRHKVAAPECVGLLLGRLERETSEEVLCSIMMALGHLNDASAIGPLLKWQTHTSGNVRYALVSSLSGHEDARAIRALVELSADENRDVKNWATFGLGSLVDWDSPELRDALFKRLTEEDAEIRGEALVGLARRGDPRVIDTLNRELSNIETCSVGSLLDEAVEAIISAAKASGAKVWRPILLKIREKSFAHHQTALAEALRIVGETNG